MIRLNRNLKDSRIISNQASTFPWRTFCEQVWSAACQGHVFQSTGLGGWGWYSSEIGPGNILFHIMLKENAWLHNSVSAIYFQWHIQLYLNGGLNSYSAFPDQKQGPVFGTVSLSSLYLWMKWCVPSPHLLQHHQCSSILTLWQKLTKPSIWESLFRSFANITPWMALPHHHFTWHLSSETPVQGQ